MDLKHVQGSIEFKKISLTPSLNGGREAGMGKYWFSFLLYRQSNAAYSSNEVSS